MPYSNAFAGPNLAQIDRDAYSNSLLKNDVARLPQRNAAEDVAMQGDAQAINQDRQANARKMAADIFTAIADAPDPIATGAMLTQSGAFRSVGGELGLPVDQFKPVQGDDPEQIRAAARSWAQAVGAQVQQTPQFGEAFSGPGGSLLQVGPDGQLHSVVGREPGIASQPRQTEPPVAVLGPDGRPVYTTREAAIGQTPYERPSGGLSARDATTARNKLTTIRLARQQIAEAREAFQPLKGTFSAGPLGGYLPTQAGQSFDAKVDTMRGTITGLKRVPGVGAMSDYETRLDQSMIPARGKYEATTEQQLNDLDTMLNYMEQGYSGLIEDGGGEMPQQGGGGASGGWTITEISR